MTYWQEIIALLIVAAAAVVLWRRLVSRHACGCGGYPAKRKAVLSTGGTSGTRDLSTGEASGTRRSHLKPEA